jgi:ATP11 protein
LEDFKKNPVTASPYMVITCFDELVRTKGIALVRGDVIAGLNKDEGQAVLNTVLNAYLVESCFEHVRKFNHEPAQFNYEEYTQRALQDFAGALDNVKKTKTTPIDIGVAKTQTWWV